MTIYRFRVIKRWYTYALLKDAQQARTYFLYTYSSEMVSEIEESDEAAPVVSAGACIEMSLVL